MIKYLFILLICIPASAKDCVVWGFYGHRKINQMACFTLPDEMFGFYKNHIDYITEHAVDPDKRRYATKHEAVRHYIDFDHWGANAKEEVPQDFSEALIKYGEFNYISGSDTIPMETKTTRDSVSIRLLDMQSSMSMRHFKTIFEDYLMPFYYEDEMKCDASDFSVPTNLADLNLDGEILFVDHFSEYGICPYNLIKMYYRLRNQFKEKDKTKLLRTISEFGHYVADAHVPLHTSENYNGQLTNQDGIHAFWESRIVELFDNEFDFMVGKADYVDNVNDYVWNIIYSSSELVDSVLTIEQNLRDSYPSDKQFCYDERLLSTVRIQCPEYARTYMEQMDGMVEQRMTEAVHALGSLWYTAWVEAGQPNLDDFNDVVEEVEVIVPDPNVKTRVHE
ncbi:MAG TPA: zinc dependent phospholipase C family protein [Saprospiraceae bacterium]|nr:hypothetical protein [Saprospiraceae bacterium]MCB9329244.1 hypothetical protein [Lewinellaceae bacterium]HRX28218.1 zinc dependent phospholipase C family protein [Saprospiraceae bacterium]